MKQTVLIFLFYFCFMSSAHAGPTSTVTPSSGQVGQLFSFEISLGTDLPAGYDTRISFGNGSGGWLSWNEMSGNSSRSIYTYSRTFSESGDRQYRYSIFKFGSQFGTISEKVLLVKERPPHYFDQISPSSPIEVNQSFTFRSLWERSFNDSAFIVDAKVRYKKRSASSWSTNSMLHYGSSGIREQFKKTISLSSAGDYEYQFQASQSKTPSSIKTESSWTRSFYFTVEQPASNDAPDLTVSDFRVSKTQLNTGESFRAYATVKNIGDAPTTAESKVYYYIRTQSTLILSNDYDNSDNVKVLGINEEGDEDDPLSAPDIANDYWVYACATGSVPTEKTLVNNCHPATRITVTEPNPEIIRVDSNKETYIVGETAAFTVPLTYSASEVTMSIMPKTALQTSETVWYFERIFESAGEKSITFSAKNSAGVVTDTFIKTVTVIDAPRGYEVTIGLNDHGTVTATGINCPNDCVETYLENTSIIFTAIPFAGYEFKAWTTHGCPNTPKSSNGNEFTITVVEDCEVRALYNPIQLQADYTISSSALVDDVMNIGEPVQLGVRLRNIGDSETNTSVLIRYYISDDLSIDPSDTYTGYDLASKLGSGDHKDYGITFSAPDVAKDYYIGACAVTTPQDANSSNDCSTGKKITVLEDESIPSRITSITALPDAIVATNSDVEFKVNTAGRVPDKVEIRFLPNTTWHQITNTNSSRNSWKYTRSFSSEGTKEIWARLDSDDATQKTTSVIVGDPQPEITNISVSPEKIIVGDTASFTLSLSAPVDEIRVSLAPHNAQAITQTEWSFNRIFNESGDKNVIFTAYVDGQVIASKVESLHVYEPTDPENQAPFFVSAWAWSDSDNSGDEVEQRRVISISSVWNDPDGDVIHGEVQYSRLGENNWSASQSTRWAKNRNDGTEIKADIQLGNIALGQYEYRIRAVDKKTDGGDPLHPWSSWVKGGEFTVIEYQNRLPQLSKADRQINRYLGSDIRIDLQATDLDDDLDYIEIDWYGDGTGDDRWEPEGNNGEINARFYLSNSFPIPTTPQSFQWSATAYDKSGGKSIKRSGWVNIIRPAPNDTGQQGEADGLAGQHENDCVVEKPIDLATGAERDTIQLLAVNGVLPIEFTLEYNSLINDIDIAGQGWSHSYGYLSNIIELENGQAIVFWSDNRHATFELQEGKYVPLDEGCKLDRLERQENGNFVVYRKDRSEYYFDEFNRVTRIQNPKVQSIDFEYSLLGQLTKVVDPISGTYLQYEYHPEEQNRLLKAVSDPLGNTVSLEYDGIKLNKIIRADGVPETFTYNEAGQVVTRNIGTILDKTNTFDDQGRVISQDDSRSDNLVSSYVYTQVDDRLKTRYTDKNGHVSEFVFDKNYRLLQTTNAENVTVKRLYDANGKINQITDGRGNQTDMTYDSNGDLLLTVYADGSKEQRVYDDKRNLIQLIDQLGQSEFYAYDDRNNLIALTDKAGNTKQLSYNNIGQLIREISPEARVTEYEYTNGLLTKIIDGEGNSRTLSYDASGRMVSQTDFAGNLTQYTYDGMGRKISEVDALGYKQTWAYDVRGNTVLYRDQNRHDRNHSEASPTTTKETRYEYDTEGNHTRTIKVYSTQETVAETLVYDGENRLISQTDGNGNITRYVRDGAGRVVKTIDADGGEYETEYDNNNNVTASLTPLAGRVDYVHDKLNRTTRVTDSLSRVSQTQYDLLGRVTKNIDPLERERVSVYSPLSQLTQVTSPGNLVSSESFDKDQFLVNATDPNSNVRTIERDGNGRITKETTADGVEITYGYDARGLMTSMVNGRGETTSYTYDELSRLIEKIDDVSTTRYVYAPNGNLLETIENGKTIDRKYFDESDRVTEYKPDDSIETRMWFEYDDVGNLKRLVYPSSNPNSSSGFPIDYTYNSRNLIKSVTSFTGNIPFSAQYEYDAKSRLVETTRGNGTVETRTYNSEDQLTQVKDVDADGNIIVQFDYVYDNLGRLIEENSIPDMTPPRWLLKEQASEYSYSEGEDNRLTSQDGKTFDFDGDGNILEAEGRDLLFNARGQLTQAGDTSYRYDAEGHRIGMTHDGQTYNYFVNPHAQLSQTLSVNTDRFIYGNGLIALRKITGEHFFYHFDFRGSVVAITDQNGTVIQRYGYLPYGKRFAVGLNPLGFGAVVPDVSSETTETDLTVESATPSTELGGSLIGGIIGAPEARIVDMFKSVFGYNGRDGVLTDPNGLYYMRARYYSPDQRRFLSKDPLRGQIGDLASLNRYGYVGGDPVNAVDPSGEKVYLQWHSVANTIYDHSLIRIVPDDQTLFADDWIHWARDSADEILHDDGKKFFTLGAGPGGFALNKLVSGFNRPKDVFQEKRGSISIDWRTLGFQCEAELIRRLVDAQGSYNNSLSYASFANPEGNRGVFKPDDGYNSNSYTNSYTNSILQRAGVFVGQPALYLPGWDVLLPNSTFE